MAFAKTIQRTFLRNSKRSLWRKVVYDQNIAVATCILFIIFVFEMFQLICCDTSFFVSAFLVCVEGFVKPIFVVTDLIGVK